VPLRFNSFYELQQFPELSDEMLEKLMPLISIYHESPVNPNYSPVEVLMQFSRVDQYRVHKLMESVDEVEKVELRKEILETLFVQETEYAEDLSQYYRVYIEFDKFLYQVILKYDRQRKKYIVVFIDANETKLDANES
jgi:hypothetical protein